MCMMFMSTVKNVLAVLATSQITSSQITIRKNFSKDESDPVPANKKHVGCAQWFKMHRRNLASILRGKAVHTNSSAHSHEVIVSADSMISNLELARISCEINHHSMELSVLNQACA